MWGTTRASAILCALALVACGGGNGEPEDGGPQDTGTVDAADGDAAPEDGGSPPGDGGTPPGDGGAPTDAGEPEDGGAPADAGGAPDGAVFVDGGTCADCLDSPLDWGFEGGFRAFTRDYQVQPCRAFTAVQRPLAGGGETLSCGNAVPCAGDAVTMSELLAALADAEVTAAFGEAPILYGRDTRPVDGSVLEITYQGKTIQIGAPCGPVGTACEPIPEGVQTLAALLAELVSEREAEEDCASILPL